jgi:Uma2 family endonuclease
MDRVAPEVWAAYEAAPEHIVAEILDGELFTFPRPGSLAARAKSELGADLGRPFDQGNGGPGGWILLDEPELHLGHWPDVLAPDLAGWRRERMPEMPDVAAFELAPDWVCEVISESTEKIDRTRKMRIYRREAVAHVWLLSPRLQTLEVYRHEAGRYVLMETYEGSAKIAAEPFDAVELDLSALWAR